MAKGAGRAGSGKGAKKAPRKPHRKSGKDRAVAALPAAPTSPAGRTFTPLPAGQRLWDMPYSSAPPRMIDPEIGLHNLVARAGHNAGYDIDLTLLDAPDHRLIRSGVVLAHRILDGRGEWYLGAPDWVPLLPKERIDPMSQGDLPEELADLIRPFRRRATLGPVAALRCERREFALRDDSGTTMALLRDDKVTVRRGGLTTARYREVMMTPVGPGLTADQDDFLCQVLAGAGATLMDRFPRLVNRLGAPANGQTDFPVPPPVDPDSPFAAVVSSLLLARLRQLLVADLRVRGDDAGGAVDLGKSAADLRQIFCALAPMLDEAWREDIDEELDWVVEETSAEDARQTDAGARSGPPVGELKARLRGERYMIMLERLVNAAKSPKVRPEAARPARAVLARLVTLGERRIGSTADRLGVESNASSWEAARVALDDLLRLYDVIEMVEPGRLTQLRAELTSAKELLAECTKDDQLASSIREAALAADASEAFELGRRFEHQELEGRTARDAFLREWASLRKHQDGKIGAERQINGRGT